MKKKILKIVGVILLIIAAVCLYFYNQFDPAEEFIWGLNFSQVRARELGFDPKTMYLDMMNDLKPKKIRLNAYWNQIQPASDKYDFQEIDEYLIFAQQQNVEVILSVGKKLPRWPECHEPDWVKQLPDDQKVEVRLKMIENTINHFKDFSAIKIWQVENEPLFYFGDQCPKIDREILKKEIALVKSLDQRPVLVTDSGELGRWIPTATTGADIFGTTMYRIVHNPTTGYFKYPLPPAFFRIKAGILNTFAKPQGILGVELQAEPWFANGIENTPLETQKSLMNQKIFAEYIEYAQKAGFKDNYLWGVEWWYWMAQKQGDWGMWAAAKDLLNK